MTLYHPGNLPERFVSLDELHRICRQIEQDYPRDRHIPSWAHVKVWERSAVRDAFLDAAEAMDEAGEIIVDRIDLHRVEIADADAVGGVK